MSDTLARLRKAAGGRCLCGRPLPELHVKVSPQSLARPNREHVFPKSPAAKDLPVIHRRRALMGGDARVIVLAHQGCNTAKGNRPPHPCEVIFLLAVNANLSAMPVAGKKKRKAKAPTPPTPPGPAGLAKVAKFQADMEDAHQARLRAVAGRLAGLIGE